MSTTQHTPGRVCDACEGFCLQPAGKVDAGVEISLRIGQRVRHTDYQGQRVTGVVHGLTIDSERGLMVDCVLDAPIVIPADSKFQQVDIHRQYAPAHEFSPFDGRDEVIAELVSVALRCEQRLAAQHWLTSGPREALPPESVLLLDLRDALAKAIGWPS